MSTYGVGLFHDEFMICKMDGIEYVQQITTDNKKIQNILQTAELKRHAKEMKESRQKKRQFVSSPIKIKGNLFDDDDEILNNGGNKKRTYKKRLNKKRKTNKTNKRKSYRKK
jgi:response regulator RpfG family c-di-GMP phosphodiesterase